MTQTIARPRPPLTWIALRAIFVETLREANTDKVPALGAALAFYSMLSIGPLVLIGLAVAAIVFGQDIVGHYVFAEIRRLVGPAAAEAIQDVVTSSHSLRGSITATVAGVLILLVSSTGFFAQLQDALNTIWDVQGKPHGFIRKRLMSFGLILAVGVLLAAAMIVSAVLSLIAARFSGVAPYVALHTANFIVSFAVITVLFAMIFNILPDVHIRWRDVWIGAGMTALLFTLGKVLIGEYLRHSSLGTTYGVAGSVIVSMVWLYYSTQIFYLGAEFTQVYARYMGSVVTLKKGRRKPIEVAKQISEG